MKVILTEKPSVARDIANFLNANKKGDGFIEGNGFVITWAFGHLVELQEPEDYDPSWKQWRLNNLPLLPKPFALKARDESSVQKQLATIKRFFEQADELICATDAGREGELIFRYILQWTECEDKPIRRLWVHSLTNEAIEKGFKSMKAGSEYEGLYRAAKCRSEADWIVGINSTRFFTLEYGQRQLLMSVGRVQTPVLAMIVRRDIEIDFFKPSNYWEVHTVYRDTTFKHEQGKFEDKINADAVIEKIKDKDLEIVDISEKNERTNPPLLYDLTDLQRDMNRRYGFTADQTLKLAQELYEKKHLTYPRTDSRYLSSDMKSSIKPLLQKLSKVESAAIQGLDLEKLNFSKRIIDDKKVSDHHAIIPTEVLAERIDGDAWKVYQAVVMRLISVFYPACVKAVTTVKAQAENEAFIARGRVLIDAGWQALYKSEEKAKDKDSQEMPRFEKGEQGPHEPKLAELKTTPPKRFNEATLLQMMETAGKAVTDESLREALKEKGVGTPATRASIIETLIQRNYVLRKKKALLSTETGRALIHLVHDQRLKSPELTGDWEYRLKKMERDEYSDEQFMNEVSDYTKEILETKANVTIKDSHIGPCPLCYEPVIKGKRAYGCSQWRNGCKFILEGSYGNFTIDPLLARELLIHHKTLKPLGFERDSKPVFGHITWDLKKGLSHTVVEIAKKEESQVSMAPCPVCGGDIIEGQKAFGCSNWKNGCGFKVWKTIAQKEISKEIAMELINNGKTKEIEGFISKKGKEFSAKLKIVRNEVKFDF